MVIIEVLIPTAKIIVCEECGWWKHPRGAARNPIKADHAAVCPNPRPDRKSFWEFHQDDMVVMINVRDHPIRVTQHRFMYV